MELYVSLYTLELNRAPHAHLLTLATAATAGELLLHHGHAKK